MDGGASRTRKKSRRPIAIFALVGGIAASGSMVYTASNAAFTAKTSNGVDEWSTGKASLTDDDTTVAMFSLTGANAISPNETGAKCIAVTYDGNDAATVKLYVDGAAVNETTPLLAPGTGKIGDKIDLLIEQGVAGPTFAGTEAACKAAPMADGTVYSGTLTGLTAATNFTNGLAAATPWAPVGGVASTKVYRFTWSTANLPDAASVMDKDFSATIAWEAKSA